MGNLKCKCSCKKNIFKSLTEKVFNNKYSQITTSIDLALTKNERYIQNDEAKKKEIADIKELHSKGVIFMSESVGRPRDIYETVENIAPITYGLIKKVRHKVTGKIRSMKIIKRELIEVEEDEIHFFKEIALVRSLDHPNIVKLYEYYQDEKYFYLLSDMFKLLKTEGGKGFSEYTVADIMRQLLSVVAYCHSNNVINRDIRLENILIESFEIRVVNAQEMPFFDIRVCDFKSSRSYKKSKKLNKKIGNPYYIAPEVLKRRYNEKIDVWSCGIIMYMLLSGKPPFKGNSEKEILDYVALVKFEFFEKDLAHCSDESKNLLNKLLKYDPVKRLNAIEALNSKWFLMFQLNSQEVLDKNFINDCYLNMLYYCSAKKFQLATVAYMIHNVVTKEELKDLKNLFEILDKDKDGKLSYDEIITGFKQLLGELKHEKEFIKNLKRIDDEKCDYLEYDKFLIAAINKENLIREEKLYLTFRLFDKDNSGSISIEELKTLLSISSKGTEKAWGEIIEQIQKLRDLEISFSTFKGLMFGLKTKKQHLDDIVIKKT